MGRWVEVGGGVKVGVGGIGFGVFVKGSVGIGVSVGGGFVALGGIGVGDNVGTAVVAISVGVADSCAIAVSEGVGFGVEITASVG